MVKQKSPAPRKQPARKPPPPNYITAKEATSILQNKMLYKYVERGLIDRQQDPLSSQGFYKRSDVHKVRAMLEAFYNPPEPALEQKNDTTFARATVNDMEGVYDVAIELFPHGTTSAEARKPLVAACPDGNYIVRENNRIVAYIHIQPLNQETMKLFLAGKIRGKDIKASNLAPLEPSKPVDVLVKSVGSTRRNGDVKSVYYTQRLLRGTSRELEKMGERGIVIRKIYATSETISGITMATHAKMRQLRALERPHDDSPGRYVYELDVATSKLPLLQAYKRALAKWQQSHPVTQD